eukprot:SAG31_NODE_3071_length_4718_cov_3.180342_4_plen_81_part_00
MSWHSFAVYSYFACARARARGSADNPRPGPAGPAIDGTQASYAKLRSAARGAPTLLLGLAMLWPAAESAPGANWPADWGL